VSCSSPFEGKVKKAKHTVVITATDAAGNASAPATIDWKVKVKRKKPDRSCFVLNPFHKQHRDRVTRRAILPPTQWKPGELAGEVSAETG
jgi:hypothetical protein